MVVLDASAALEWLLPSKRTREIHEQLFEARLEGLRAPTLLQLEVANGLRTNVRQRRIDADYRDRALDRFFRLGVEYESESQQTHVLTKIVSLSGSFGLSVYDAAYLELAMRLEASLLSLDAELAAAGRSAGLQVLPA